MKKIKLSLVFLMSLSLAPQSLLAASGASGSKFSQMANIGTAGAAGAYSAANQAACGPHNSAACIQAIMGILQMIQSLMGAANSGDTGAALLNGDYGDFAFDPAESGFCFDVSTGCTPDAIDGQLGDLETAFKTGEGYDTALEKMKDDAVNRLKALEDKGYKVDSAAGTITGPDGKTTSFADAAAQVPASLSASANKKFADVMEKLSETDAARGLASDGSAGGTSGGAGGGTIIKDEFYGGLGKNGSGQSGKTKSKKDKKKSLLASLTDKDAKKGAIGIAGDNIFGMVNRRYIKKTKSAEFLKNK